MKKLMIVLVLMMWVGTAWGAGVMQGSGSEIGDALTFQVWSKAGGEEGGDLEIRSITYKPDPTRVWAYRASDGKLFESREEMAEHELAILLIKNAVKSISEHTRNRESVISHAECFRWASIIKRNWPEILEVMSASEPK